MNYCYSCNTPLKRKNNCNQNEIKNRLYKSKQHIIPNFLGGYLTSYNLLCKRCNSELGSSIDSVLSKELIFSRQIIFPSDRKYGNRKVTGKIKGNKVELLMDREGNGLFVKPQILFDTEGKVVYIAANDKHIAIKLLKKHSKSNPEFDLDNYLQNANWNWSEKNDIQVKIRSSYYR